MPLMGKQSDHVDFGKWEHNFVKRHEFRRDLRSATEVVNNIKPVPPAKIDPFVCAIVQLGELSQLVPMSVSGESKNPDLKITCDVL